MKRKYEVSYIECGVYKKRSRVFRSKFIAYMFKGYMEYKLGYLGLVVIRVL